MSVLFKLKVDLFRKIYDGHNILILFFLMSLFIFLLKTVLIVSIELCFEQFIYYL